MKSYSLLLPILTITLTSCTYNISMAHTEGQASDVVDTEQSPTNDVKPSLEIPLPKL